MSDPSVYVAFYAPVLGVRRALTVTATVRLARRGRRHGRASRVSERGELELKICRYIYICIYIYDTHTFVCMYINVYVSLTKPCHVKV